MRLAAWFARLDDLGKAAMVGAVLVTVLPVILVIATVPVLAIAAVSQDEAASGTSVRTFADTEPDSEAAPEPQPAITSTANESMVVAIPFESVEVEDPAMPLGTTAVTTAGVAGTLIRTYEVTYVDGAVRTQRMVSEVTSMAPVTQVTSVGTYVAPPPPPARAAASGGCDPNYADACVPIASDVDCAGGSGNGPAYVSGVVRVIGSDIYDLDRDGDGYGCD